MCVQKFVCKILLLYYYFEGTGLAETLISSYMTQLCAYTPMHMCLFVSKRSVMDISVGTKPTYTEIYYHLKLSHTHSSHYPHLSMGQW
jgi:hypothetical protein